MVTVAALARRLHSSRQVDQISAARDMLQITAHGTEQQRVELALAGSRRLAQLLTSPRPAHYAARVLCGLTVQVESAVCAAVASSGAIPCLLACAAGSGEPRAADGIRCDALNVLRLLSHQSHARSSAIIAEGASVLVSLCSHDNEQLREHACSTFQLLCMSLDTSSLTALLDAGVVDAMLRVIRDPASSADMLKSAANALACLYCDEPEFERGDWGATPENAQCAKAAAVAAGAPAALMALLHGAPDEEVEAQAAAALASLVGHAQPAVTAAVVESGAVASLSERLGSGDHRMRASAALFFCHITRDPAAELCSVLASAGSIPRLVQLLRQPPVSDAGAEVDKLVQESMLLATLALQRLVDANHAGVREAVVASGAIDALAALLGDRQQSLMGLSEEADLLVAASKTLQGLAASGHSEALLAAGAPAALQALAQATQLDSVRAAASEALQHLASVPAPAAVPSTNTAASTAPSFPPWVPRPPRVCSGPDCGAAGACRLNRCRGCGTVRYCSRQCQHAHWPQHRATCRRLRAEYAQQAPAAAGAEADPDT